MPGRHHPRFAASVLIKINSLWFFVIASVHLGPGDVASPQQVEAARHVSSANPRLDRGPADRRALIPSLRIL